MTGILKRTTTNYSLRIPIFDAPGWGREVERNFDIIDAVMLAISGFTNISGVWANGTMYAVGQRLVDQELNLIYECRIAHTSAAVGTFEDDRAAHPTYWAPVVTTATNRGQWITGIDYFINDFLYDANKFGVCTQKFTSSASYDQDVIDGNIVTLIDLSGQLATSVAKAAEAVAAAAAALASKNTAALSETAAGTSETNALASKNAAATSEANAAASATAASGSANTANTKAGQAATSATNAAASEVAAANSAGSAAGSAGTATAKATAAATSATNAAASDTHAQTLVNDLMALYDGFAGATAAGLAMLKAADVAAQRVLLGLKAIAISGNADDLTGTIPDGVLPGRIRYGSQGVADWNLAAGNGWYMGESLPNAPEPVGWFIGEAIVHNDQYVTQTLHKFVTAGAVDTHAWRRHLQGGVWSAWYKLQISQAEQDGRYVRLAGSTLYGGYSLNAAPADGVMPSSYSPTINGGNLRWCQNAGNTTLNADPATDSVSYTMILAIFNVAGAGVITMSGFTRVTGDAFTTVVGSSFLVFVTRVGSSKHAHIVAMQ